MSKSRSRRENTKNTPAYRPVCVHLKVGIAVIGGKIRYVCKDCKTVIS
ncbi:hypothetical protein AB0J51_03985 [Micromonospora echinofusca]